jgi:DNA-binding transcriptional regulator YhcF (GntR family)
VRRESLSELTHRFINEAYRLGFSEREVSQMVRSSLKSWKEAKNVQDEE